MSTFWMVLFLTTAAYLFGAAGWYGFKHRQEFKRLWAELERALDDGDL